MRHHLPLMLSFVLGGCASLGYYGQSVQGQIGVMAASRPIEEVIDDPQTPESVRSHLQVLPELRRFAAEALALPETDSYRL